MCVTYVFYDNSNVDGQQFNGQQCETLIEMPKQKMWCVYILIEMFDWSVHVRRHCRSDHIRSTEMPNTNDDGIPSNDIFWKHLTRCKFFALLCCVFKHIVNHKSWAVWIHLDTQQCLPKFVQLPPFHR